MGKHLNVKSPVFILALWALAACTQGSGSSSVPLAPAVIADESQYGGGVQASTTGASITHDQAATGEKVVWKLSQADVTFADLKKAFGLGIEALEP